MRHHDQETVEKLRRIEVVDRRVKELQAERQKLLAKLAEHVHDRDTWQFLYQLYFGYVDSMSVAERGNALVQARAAAAKARAVDRLVGFNADLLRRLAKHRNGLVMLSRRTK